MRIDLESEPMWASADVCIIGAGPAGLVVAAELAATGTSVVVLESGGVGDESFPQRLNEAATPASYGELHTTRHRQVGGTVNIWNTDVAGVTGAKYVPLDPIDLRSRHWRSDAWPIDYAELVPYYQRAQQLAGLGAFRYAAEAWMSEGRRGFSLASSVLTNAVYQFGQSTPILEHLPRRLESAENVQLVTHGTVVELDSDDLGRRVRAARIATRRSTAHTLTAERFVLAAGAVESARLLLASQRPRPEGLANSSGWVGRGFMEHPRDYALSLVPTDTAVIEDAAFYDRHRARDGTWLMGRLALREAFLAEADVPNASVTLLAGTTNTRGRQIVRALRTMLGLTTPYPRGGSGWTTEPGWVPDRFRLLINFEQAPNAANRIVLGDDRDALGVRRAQLIWQWREAEQEGLTRLRRIIADELVRHRLGRVDVDERALPDPRAHHHAGTLRMHDDARSGVVDRNARAHDLENLYCAGAAVLPTAGFANPMLTILALSLRLADHLRGVR